MPTYDYKCDACGHAFEKFQSIMADAIKTCPACGEDRAKRLIGIGAGFLFKGGGFYQTDYRSDNYKKGEKAEGGGKPSGGGESKGGDKAGGESKSETSKGGESTGGEGKPAESKRESKPAAAPSSEAKPATKTE